MAGTWLLAVGVAGCLGPSPSAGPSDSVPAPVSTSAATLSASPIASDAPSASPGSTPATVATLDPCPGVDRTPGAAAGRQLVGSSTNWSGYVAAVRRTGVTCVEGRWIEPRVTCAKTGHQAVAIWIGIDGFSTKTLGIPSTDVLIQLGSQVECSNGVASHGIWHEVLPAEGQEVHERGPIKAGDHLAARILYVGSKFTMSIVDSDSGFAFSLTASAPDAPRRTAEWIVEAPATDCPGSCQPVHMPHFSPITFSNAHATILGQRSSINDDSWTNIKLRIFRNGVRRTSTSSLAGHGTSFTVTWLHA